MRKNTFLSNPRRSISERRAWAATLARAGRGDDAAVLNRNLDVSTEALIAFVAENGQAAQFVRAYPREAAVLGVDVEVDRKRGPNQKA